MRHKPLVPQRRFGFSESTHLSNMFIPRLGYLRYLSRYSTELAISVCGTAVWIPGFACSVFFSLPKASKSARQVSRGTISSSHWTKNRTGHETSGASRLRSSPLGPDIPMRPSNATRIRESVAVTGNPIMVPIDSPHQHVGRAPSSDSMKFNAACQSYTMTSVPPPSFQISTNTSEF